MANLQSDRPRSNLISITFDDGYENNYSVAWPILRRYGIPAPFYLAINFIEKSRLYWVDQVEHWLNLRENIEIELHFDN